MRLQLFVICYILHSVHADVESCARQQTVMGDEIAEFLPPYQCSLQLNGEHQCSCSVINPHFVITASHCVSSMTLINAAVMVGSNNRKSGGTYYEVDRLIPHEDYNKTNLANDIALVEVKEPIEFNEKVDAINLEDKAVPDGTKVLLAGWRRLEKDGIVPDELQFIKSKILETTKCRNSYVSDSNMCTDGITENGACQYDSGSALVHDNKLVGFVSYGIPCSAGEPDIYVNVSYFADWIREHLSRDPQEAGECNAEDNEHDDDDDNISDLSAVGRTAPDNLAPFQCSLQVFKNHHCGCAVISPYFVLTASSCFEKENRALNANAIRIMVGSNALSCGGTYHKAERLIPHEKYNKADHANDIALVKVKRPIVFDESVQAIELGDIELSHSTEVRLTGWGSAIEDHVFSKLKYINLHILDHAACKNANLSLPIQDHHICSLNVFGGICEDDSGGPLVHKGKIIGIANFGEPCYETKPDVYANVSYFADWITKHLSAESQQFDQ